MLMNSFKDIIGQDQIIKYISTAIIEEKLSHAYILSGEKGSGKKMIAGLFSMLIQCERKENYNDVCGQCQSCKQAVNNNQPDIIKVTHEKANAISVEDVRAQINSTVGIKPYSSPYKVYIIENAELMTPQAQNALLKSIEEPPEYAVFMLLTQNMEMLLPTIKSRCVLLKLRNIKDELIKQYLIEKMNVPEDQANLCVAFAVGNIGRATTLAKSEHFEKMKSEVIHLVINISHMETEEIFQVVKQMVEYKPLIVDYLDLMAVWYRDVLVYKATKNMDAVIFREQIWSIKQKASISSYAGIEKIIVALEKTKARLKANVNFDLAMELLLLTMKEN